MFARYDVHTAIADSGCMERVSTDNVPCDDITNLVDCRHLIFP